MEVATAAEAAEVVLMIEVEELLMEDEAAAPKEAAA